MRLGLQVRKNPFANGGFQQPFPIQEVEMNEENKSSIEKENIQSSNNMQPKFEFGPLNQNKEG